MWWRGSIWRWLYYYDFWLILWLIGINLIDWFKIIVAELRILIICLNLLIITSRINFICKKLILNIIGFKISIDWVSKFVWIIYFRICVFCNIVRFHVFENRLYLSFFQWYELLSISILIYRHLNPPLIYYGTIWFNFSLNSFWNACRGIWYPLLM